MKVKPISVGLAVLASCAIFQPRVAHACGGFFCGRTPVDQTAERILFAVGESTTTMAVQIQYAGEAADFAWVLPLAEVPDEESLAVFPQRALTALDANTGPVFQLPGDSACYRYNFGFPTAAGGVADAGVVDESVPPPVTIHYEVEVGPYGVAVVESTDPDALVTWLRENGYRVAPAMEPYIDVYTGEGMKFLALKLLPEQGADDIQPLRFTLPGQSPSIPIRLTSLAAEPEMSLLVFVLADQRFEGANWESVTIDDAQIHWANDSFSFNIRTNWAALVAKGIDEAGGHGWVTELAGSTAPYVDLLQNRTFNTPEDQEAGTELLGLLNAHPYITRLYARVSAEEMTLDPVFRRSSDGDVSNVRQLERYVNGEDLCDVMTPPGPPPFDPCDFTTCGAAGECFTVAGGDAGASAPGCACVPGATARTTFDPSGGATVICQDLRMSFLNPGDRDVDGDVLPDTCAGFECGEGHCETVNLTPTCVCNVGTVAVGSFDDQGGRVTRCVAPDDAVPTAFYSRRLPALPAELPGGRPLEPTMAPPGMEDVMMMPPENGADTGNDDNAGHGSGSEAGCGACTLGAARGGSDSGKLGWAALGALALASAFRRRRIARFM